MKIWMDLTNSPHISFFRHMIDELKNESHEIIVTTRPLSNTIQLLELYGIPYTILGTHYGKKNLHKLLGFPIRVLQLYSFLRKQKPNIAIAQASYYLPVVAKMLGIPSIYTNDNENAKGNWPAFLCADKIFIPEFLESNKITNFFVKEKKIEKYPGVKEGIYLWNVFKDFKFIENSKQKKIYIRLEPSLAQYYRGGEYFLDNLILKLQDIYNIVIIPREKDQTKHYLEERFSRVEVLQKPKKITDIALDCLLFIGAGGTMTREMAIIGISTISVYQDNLLAVDKYLIQNGYMHYSMSLSVDDVINFISREKPRKSTDLLEKGEEAYNLIKESLVQMNIKKPK